MPIADLLAGKEAQEAKMPHEMGLFALNWSRGMAIGNGRVIKIAAAIACLLCNEQIVVVQASRLQLLWQAGCLHHNLSYGDSVLLADTGRLAPCRSHCGPMALKRYGASRPVVQSIEPTPKEIGPTCHHLGRVAKMLVVARRF